jgi:hypothetical protein
MAFPKNLGHLDFSAVYKIMKIILEDGKWRIPLRHGNRYLVASDAHLVSKSVFP